MHSSLRCLTQCQTILLLALSILSTALPTGNLQRHNTLITRAANNFTEFVNGSMIMIPKCQDLGECGNAPNETLHKRAIPDRGVDPALDVDGLLKTYVKEVNRWLLGRLWYNDQVQAFVSAEELHLTPGIQLDQINVPDLPDQAHNQFNVHYIVPPYLLREFAEVHLTNDLDIYPADLQNLNRTIGYRDQTIHPDPALVRQFTDVTHLFGSDFPFLSARLHGLAGEGLALSSLDLMENVFRYEAMETSPEMTNAWNTQVTAIANILNEMYPRSQPQIGHAWTVYANSAREAWIANLRNARGAIGALAANPGGANAQSPTPAPSGGGQTQALPAAPAPQPPADMVQIQIPDNVLHVQQAGTDPPNFDTDLNYVRQFLIAPELLSTFL